MSQMTPARPLLLGRGPEHMYPTTISITLKEGFGSNSNSWMVLCQV